ncbi:unnamed protein product [Schistosoma curassoni]|uniref:Secreted protein n=1 Tax=Schistosoma curassoni TaxID=6186 RepID=A0A183JLE0_9TREM|nr:unnamed protein product [Schistosoma curassoni]
MCCKCVECGSVSLWLVEPRGSLWSRTTDFPLSSRSGLEICVAVAPELLVGSQTLLRVTGMNLESTCELPVS